MKYSDQCLPIQGISRLFGLSYTSPQDRKPRRALRRGESGYNPEDIERFEQMGFVMSGSRRKGKQNEEASKKGDFKSQKKEKDLQEMELVARFKEMIEERNALRKQI